MVQQCQTANASLNFKQSQARSKEFLFAHNLKTAQTNSKLLQFGQKTVTTNWSILIAPTKSSAKLKWCMAHCLMRMIFMQWKASQVRPIKMWLQFSEKTEISSKVKDWLLLKLQIHETVKQKCQFQFRKYQHRQSVIWPCHQTKGGKGLKLCSSAIAWFHCTESESCLTNETPYGSDWFLWWTWLEICKRNNS